MILCIDELITGSACIVEVVNYEDGVPASKYYVQRFERPADLILEPADKCAQELRHLVGTGKFAVDIMDEDWEKMKAAGTAQTRMFTIVSDETDS